VNDAAPTNATGGPIEGLEELPAWVFSIGDEIKFTSPARSVQFILIEPDQVVSVRDDGSFEEGEDIPARFTVYPNPARDLFEIDLPRGGFNKVEIVDLLGRTVYSKTIDPAATVLQLQHHLPSGSYFVRLHNNREVKITKLIVSK
jgi:hypothetical protein